MSNATPNPVAHTFGTPEPVSAVQYHIAGILVTVHGLDEVAASTKDVAVLWLLHPRLQTQACMAPFAATMIRAWNQHQGRGSGSRRSKPPKGLIAVSFDQRNHGTREVSAIANEAWRSGNERHALDMFSCYAGTAADVSLLLDYLAGYVFPRDERRIVQSLVLGVSLGGHAAWHCVMQDARISAAVVTIGCPDYARVMTDRARLSRRKAWSDTQGRGFLGSPDFPAALVDAVRRYDPAGLLWAGSGVNWRAGQEHLHDTPSAEDKALLMPLMARCFANKHILTLSGGSDKLVNYSHSKPFLDWIKKAIAKGGWFEGGGLHLEDIVYPGVGHDVSPDMVPAMVKFVNETLDNEQVMTHDKLASKM